MGILCSSVVQSLECLYFLGCHAVIIYFKALFSRAFIFFFRLLQTEVPYGRWVPKQ